MAGLLFLSILCVASSTGLGLQCLVCTDISPEAATRDPFLPVSRRQENIPACSGQDATEMEAETCPVGDGYVCGVTMSTVKTPQSHYKNYVRGCLNMQPFNAEKKVVGCENLAVGAVPPDTDVHIERTICSCDTDLCVAEQGLTLTGYSWSTCDSGVWTGSHCLSHGAVVGIAIAAVAIAALMFGLICCCCCGCCCGCCACFRRNQPRYVQSHIVTQQGVPVVVQHTTTSTQQMQPGYTGMAQQGNPGYHSAGGMQQQYNPGYAGAMQQQYNPGFPGAMQQQSNPGYPSQMIQPGGLDAAAMSGVPPTYSKAVEDSGIRGLDNPMYDQK